MKKLFITLVVFAIGLCCNAAQSYGMRVEKYSAGGTFNMSKPAVVAPAVGHVNTTGEARLVGYYPHRRSTKMIPRHDGQYKTYERKTVKRTCVNKTQYRDADLTRKTQYKNAAYRNQTLQARR